MNKIAFKPHETRGQEIIRILENMGGVNKYNLDGSKGIIAIETKAGNYITNDWDILGLTKLGYKIYTIEEYFVEIYNTLKNNICEKTPSPPTSSFDELVPILCKKLISLEDACEWIKENFECYVGADVSPYYIYVDEFVEDFRKAMED